MLARFHYIVHCLFSRTVAGIAPSENRGKNWIQRQFRGETKPSKHCFVPSEQIRRTSWQVRLSEVASLRVSTAFKHLSGAVPTTIFFDLNLKPYINQYSPRYEDY